MPETEKFDIQRREKNGGTWSSWTIIATSIDSTAYSYDSTEEEYKWEDENAFEYGVEYEYQVRESTEPSDWSEGMSYIWDISDGGSTTHLIINTEGEGLDLIPIPQLTATDMTTHILLEWVVA